MFKRILYNKAKVSEQWPPSLALFQDVLIEQFSALVKGERTNNCIEILSYSYSQWQTTSILQAPLPLPPTSEKDTESLNLKAKLESWS